MAIRHHRRTTADELVLVDSLRAAPSGLQTEQFDDGSTSYLDDVIPKPWGNEFRVYADDLYDVWKLCLRPGQSTSVHCHPRKETALLCLSGQGRIQLIDDENSISGGDIGIIGKGVFHGTTNAGPDDLHLVEVEVPRNKFDLVRLHDRYGRRGEQYETARANASSALQPGMLVTRSKLRHGVTLDGFQFGVRAGLDLATRPVPNLLFAVSLSVGDALDHQITVLPAAAVARTVDHEQLYLYISRSNSEE